MSLSIKAMSPDPYIGIENKYKVGEVYEVKISKLTDFGAFAELDAGIAGLIHTSEIKHLNKNVNPRTVFKVGDVVKVKLKELGIDIKSRPVEIGYELRCCKPIAFDLTLCTLLGIGVKKLFDEAYKFKKCLTYIIF